MNIKPFELERYFAKYEFSVKYLMSSSDNEPLSQKALLAMASPESKKLWDDLKLGYTESQGNPLLRQEIATLYKGIKSNQVLIAAPQEGIFIAMNSILEKGDHVICIFPAYQSLYEVAASLGCEITKWVLDESKDWGLSLSFLENSIKKNTKLIVVNFPDNPTGYLPSKSFFEKIIQIARKHNLYLFSDEMYRFLEYKPEEQLPSACELYDKAIVLFGMSKTFGLPGLRIGWLVTKNEELYKKFTIFKDYTTICSSAPSEILALIGLQNRQTIINKHLKRIKSNLELLDDFFEENKELFSWVRPKAGTVAFPRIDINMDSFNFCETIVKNEGILLIPSTAFGFENKHFRFGVGRDNFAEGLIKLNLYIRKKFK